VKLYLHMPICIQYIYSLMRHRNKFTPTFLPIGLLKVKFKKKTIRDTRHIRVDEVDAKLHIFLIPQLDGGLAALYPRTKGKRLGGLQGRSRHGGLVSDGTRTPTHLKSLY
jgi:hypothetical protein